MGYIKPHTPSPRKPARNRQGPPIHMPQFCVFYSKDGQEHKTAWMNQERAHQAAEVLRRKHGRRNVAIYRD